MLTVSHTRPKPINGKARSARRRWKRRTHSRKKKILIRCIWLHVYDADITSDDLAGEIGEDAQVIADEEQGYGYRVNTGYVCVNDEEEEEDMYDLFHP